MYLRVSEIIFDEGKERDAYSCYEDINTYPANDKKARVVSIRTKNVKLK